MLFLGFNEVKLLFETCPSEGLFMTPKPSMLMIAGFGDNASMFAPFLNTVLAEHVELKPLNLSGFGAPPLNGETGLESLAECVAEQARANGAEIILAHSVASIIASFAVQADDCPLNTVLSLEGNITAEDAYFSGMAADYPDAESFQAAFLARLDEMANDNEILARYRREVENADPQSLWSLGCDARRFSDRIEPGLVLMAAPRMHYFYNPDNCPKLTLERLETHNIPRTVLKGASHWASLDQPDLLARAIIAALSR
jgi:pimeloyl-ACP methyl ester carboxylesterase